MKDNRAIAAETKDEPTPPSTEWLESMTDDGGGDVDFLIRDGNMYIVSVTKDLFREKDEQS